MSLIHRLLFVLLSSVFLIQCAVVNSPTGGEKDLAGPILDTLRSSPNFVTNVRPQLLTLEFDEFIQLKNASRDIVLTPTPIEGRPRYEQRGRIVRVDLSNVVLRDSTTYQIQFGESIQDLNEGNPAERLKYVFSTGDYLDSLVVTGKVKTNFDGQPALNALVGLYRSSSDTALTKSAPDYFTRTDSSGRFKLDYLAAGTYQLAAYADENANYRLNQGIEQVGFLDSVITVSPSSAGISYSLSLSAERPPLIVLRAEQLFPGLARLTLNQPVPKELEVLDLPGNVLAQYQTADSLFVAYAPAIDTLKQIVVSFEGEVDTASFRKTLSSSAPDLKVAKAWRAIGGTSQIELDFSLPLASFDESRILVLKDTIAYPKGTFSISGTDARVLSWTTPTDTVKSLQVQWLPGALTTVFDSVNTDTLTIVARFRRKAEFGNVALTLVGLDSAVSYVVELVNEKGNVDRTILLPSYADTLKSTATRSELLALSKVEAGIFSVRIIEDTNNDGRYSPGDRRLGRQPEQVRVFPLQAVRADWQVEEQIEYNPPFGKTPDDSERAPEN